MELPILKTLKTRPGLLCHDSSMWRPVTLEDAPERLKMRRCAGAPRGGWFDSRLSRLHYRRPQGCCWCYERRIFSSFFAQSSQLPPQTFTHAHTFAPITQQLFSPSRASSHPHTQPSVFAKLHGAGLQANYVAFLVAGSGI